MLSTASRMKSERGILATTGEKGPTQTKAKIECASKKLIHRFFSIPTSQYGNIQPAHKSKIIKHLCHLINLINTSNLGSFGLRKQLITYSNYQPKKGKQQHRFWVSKTQTPPTDEGIKGGSPSLRSILHLLPCNPDDSPQTYAKSKIFQVRIFWSGNNLTQPA